MRPDGLLSEANYVSTAKAWGRRCSIRQKFDPAISQSTRVTRSTGDVVETSAPEREWLRMFPNPLSFNPRPAD
jgi:hypothetical protein